MSPFIGTPSLRTFFAATHFQLGGYWVYAEFKHPRYNLGVSLVSTLQKKPDK